MTRPTFFSRQSLAFLAALALAWPALQAKSGETTPDRYAAALPDASLVLAGVRDAFPPEPVTIRAELQAKDRRGTIERSWNAELDLDWKSEAPHAEYVLSDAFGTEQARLRVDWGDTNGPSYTYFAEGGDEPAAVPDLQKALPDMDFSWADLTLSFLWWKGGQTVGLEEVKGRLCYVIDLPAPHDHDETLVGMRLWIDSEVRVLLRAEGYDANNKLVRRLDVKSFKKVDELWTVQDIDVQSFPSRHKTVLRVRDMDLAGEPAEAE